MIEKELLKGALKKFGKGCGYAGGAAVVGVGVGNLAYKGKKMINESKMESIKDDRGRDKIERADKRDWKDFGKGCGYAAGAGILGVGVANLAYRGKKALTESGAQLGKIAINAIRRV